MDTSRKSAAFFQQLLKRGQFIDALKMLEVTFFYTVVDAVKSSVEDRFVGFREVRDKFSVLLNFKSLTLGELGAQCETLSKTLSTNKDADISGREPTTAVKRNDPA